ncbi:MAG: PAS domain-containing protein [Mycobacterium sp.]
MAHDWLLVETLGEEPVVVAQGSQPKNLVPLTVFLRRNPHVADVVQAVNDTAASATAQTSYTTKRDRLIRAEPVLMSDGRVHGVHVWLGPVGVSPPQRSVPGPLVWNLTTGVATDTPQSLANSGMDPSSEKTHGRTFAEDLPTRDLNPSEIEVLSMAVKSRPDYIYCNTWDVTDHAGELITVSFVSRTNLEKVDDGAEHMLARAMNWRSERAAPVVAPDLLAQRILDGLARPGSYRALVDVNTWTLLKWIDEPCPLYDWRGRDGSSWVHPGDTPLIAAMTSELDSGMTQRVLRLPGHDTDWVAIHVTVHRVELEPDTYAGLITLRAPTEAEAAHR